MFQAVSCIAFLLINQLVLSQKDGNSCHCAVPGVSIKFKSCAARQAEWRHHGHLDVGLVGSCIPDVPVK